MLWAAGQKRVVREARAGLVDLFTGVRDGYMAVMSQTGQLQRTLRLPEYVTTALAEERSPEQRNADTAADLARLMRDVPPNTVREPMEFRN